MFLHLFVSYSVLGLGGVPLIPLDPETQTPRRIGRHCPGHRSTPPPPPLEPEAHPTAPIGRHPPIEMATEEDSVYPTGMHSC